MKNPIAPLVMAALSVTGCAATASAQSVEHRHIPTTLTIPPSNIAYPGDAGLRAHTNLRIMGTGAMTGKPQLAGPPFPGYLFETPASIACIYGLQPRTDGCNPNLVSSNPQGGSRAIAIVDAYDDATVYVDLQNFSAQFGVAPITPSSFQVVYAPVGGTTPGSCTSGTAPRPPSAANYGWDLEESLDVQWSHAMAPSATLYLVEAQSNSFSDLFCALSVASSLVAAAGGGEVSMSWGGGEFADETLLDPLFTTRKVVYFASSGDSSGVIYPSASPNVVSVGGTSLTTDSSTGNFVFENTWQDTGGGLSYFEPRPFYQNGIAHLVGSQRGTPDVAADANPSSGVWVLDTLVYGPGTWYVVGGTSLSSPLWAGIVNAAGRFSESSAAELRKLYEKRDDSQKHDDSEKHDDSHGLTDITYGNCGMYVDNFAQHGWDFCSGNGSPDTYAGK